MNPAPFSANLHIYFYEYKFINKFIKTNAHMAMKYRHSIRFIDDECNLNDGGEFGKCYHLIITGRS